MPIIKVISEKKGLHFESDTNFPNLCRKSRWSLKKKKVFILEEPENFPIQTQNHGDL